jgi:hypothetical protein
MGAYTPGPWEYKNNPYDLKIYNGLGLEVAQVAHDWIHGSTQANARLIAAAPELLDALELVVGTYDEGGWPSATIVIAKAALEKARGA